MPKTSSAATKRATTKASAGKGAGRTKGSAGSGKSAKSAKTGSRRKGSTTTSRAAKGKAPWNKPAPKDAAHTHLSPRKKAAAKRAAKRAGRPYPNLVDNMRAAGKRGGKGKGK
jgi:hypothetical protein